MSYMKLITTVSQGADLSDRQALIDNREIEWHAEGRADKIGNAPAQVPTFADPRYLLTNRVPLMRFTGAALWIL